MPFAQVEHEHINELHVHTVVVAVAVGDDDMVE